MVGTAVIAAAAVLTVATAGTGTALACFAVGALKGAAVGAAMGAVSGATTGAITHRVSTGSWEGAGQAALEGAADGYMTGAISGFISGGMTSNACFVAGTAVLVSSGYVAIEDIRAGDYVWAWDEETGDIALKRVVETYVNESKELIHLFVNGEEIITTPTHPFYSPVKGWTDAVRLRAGDVLVLVNGNYVVVEKIQHEILEAPVKVYNFHVEDYHTYYVAYAGILVHNVCVNQNNPGATGQAHHPISRKIQRQASQNPNLKGLVTRKSWGTIKASSLKDHMGYQKWHRNFDKGVEVWLKNHKNASADDFLKFMNDLYGSPVAQSKFGSVTFSW